MIRTRNKMIKLLNQHLGKPVVPNNETENRPAYPYVDYSITTVTNDAGEGNYSFKNGEDKVELQKKLSLSINTYSRDEVESYNLCKQAWNFFKHIVSMDDLTVVDLKEIMNRSILEVDKYEFRYGFDLFIRFDDSIVNKTEGIDLDDLQIMRSD